jgi:hypothetical protein
LAVARAAKAPTAAEEQAEREAVRRDQVPPKPLRRQSPAALRSTFTRGRRDSKSGDASAPCQHAADCGPAAARQEAREARLAAKRARLVGGAEASAEAPDGAGAGPSGGKKARRQQALLSFQDDEDGA